MQTPDFFHSQIDAMINLRDIGNPLASTLKRHTSNAFREDDYTHEQVFGHLQQEPFSTSEAAEYLEVSMPTLRRYVQSGKLVPSHTVGRNQMFSTQALRAFKREKN